MQGKNPGVNPILRQVNGHIKVNRCCRRTQLPVGPYVGCTEYSSVSAYCQ